MSDYVLDASVAVASLRPNEPRHTTAQKCVLPLLMGRDTIVVPAIFGVEVAAALARVGFNAADAQKHANVFLDRARIVTIGPRAARGAAGVATRAALRAADALYLWVAIKEGLPLITLDSEMLSRGAALWKDIHLP